jgi:D-alanyl-lipoteichoic acid acyltransferase DltB (MBOAT superfamily)
LIAGPIVRARELLHQFDTAKRFDLAGLTRGIHLFALGFGMKVFVADLLSPYVEMIYGTPGLQGFDTSWVATYSFAIQIYCDFAGYTLMGQGSAQMMGYMLPENFNAPYFAFNISEFWRRWHMSLSRWLKDYLYIPLGGSHCSRLQTYRNLFITMGLGGLWHGANWTFVAWGLYQGLLLSLHKFFTYFKVTRFVPRALALLITFHAVCLGWVFFRAPTFPQAFHLLGTMFNPTTAVGLKTFLQGTIETGKPAYNGETALFIVCTFLLVHGFCRIYAKEISHPKMRDVSIGFAYFVLIYLGITMQTQSQQFIYFQF